MSPPHRLAPPVEPDTPARSRAGRGLDLLRHALRGTGGDPTAGPVPRAIVLLAVPMVLEMAMESIFAVVDIFWVSRLGPAAVAAVGVTESLLTMVYTLAIGLSIGVTALVARRVGEGDREGAARTAVQALALGIAASALLGALGFLYAPRLLALMGADAEVVRVGSGYATIMLGGNAAVLLLFLLNAAFRGAGDAAIAMRVLWLANGINLVLDPCLIFGLGPFPELGVTGAAVATTTGRGTAVLLQLAILFRLGNRLRAAARHVRLSPDIMGRLLRVSATGTLQVFIGTASWIALVRIIAGFGSEALAGYTIVVRIVMFALLPAWGLANAAATMVGQSLGARDPERAEAAVWIAARMNFFILGSVGLAFLIFAPSIVGIFGGADPRTLDYGTDGLRIIAAGFFFYAYGMVMVQAFNGAGDTWTPTRLNLLCFWLWEIPLAYVLAHHAGLGPNGVFAAVLLAFSTYAVVSAALFRRGHWKAVIV
jgi:putative MATE family efflux protein